MLAKFINASEIEYCPKNGWIAVNGETVAVSGLREYLAENPDIAIANGYKSLTASEVPTDYDPGTQNLSPCYTDGESEITQGWTITDVEAE